MSAFFSSPNGIEPVRDRLWLAVATFLAGYKGQSRVRPAQLPVLVPGAAAGSALDRHANYILAAFMAAGT